MRVSRTNEKWTFITRKSVEQDRYRISTNGKIFDTIGGVYVSYFKYKQDHLVVVLRTEDGKNRVFNVISLMIESFKPDEYNPSGKFYYLNGDINDLYINNIKCITKNNKMVLDIMDLHHMCKMISNGKPDDEIINNFSTFNKKVVKRAINDIKNHKKYDYISHLYGI